MSALEEITSTLGQHKGKFAVGSLLFLAGACGLYGFFNSGQQNPPITEIAPTIAPTDGFGSGGGGGVEQEDLSNTISERCIYIHNLPQGRQTTWSALKELSARSGWSFPGGNRVVLVHRLGNLEGPFSVQEAVQTKSLVHNGDSWCSDPTQ